MTLRTTMMAGVAVSALLTPLALAHDGHHKAHGGFSIGAQAGYVTGESRLSKQFNFGANFSPRSDLAGRGAVGGLSLAYGHVFSNHLFAGLELRGEFAGLSGSASEGQFNAFRQTVDLKMKNSFGAALKLGMVVNSVLPYAQVGIVSSKWDSHSNVVATGLPASSQNISASKRLTGCEFGVGIDVPVAERWTVGGKFLHTEYGKLNYSHLAGVDLSVKPRTNAMFLTAKYRFW